MMHILHAGAGVLCSKVLIWIDVIMEGEEVGLCRVARTWIFVESRKE